MITLDLLLLEWTWNLDVLRTFLIPIRVIHYTIILVEIDTASISKLAPEIGTVMVNYLLTSTTDSGISTLASGSSTAGIRANLGPT